MRCPGRVRFHIQSAATPGRRRNGLKRPFLGGSGVLKLTAARDSCGLAFFYLKREGLGDLHNAAAGA